MECNLCQSVLSELGLLPCGHCFFITCLTSQLQRRETKCATCQSEFQFSNIENVSKCLVHLSTASEESASTEQTPTCTTCDHPHPATKLCVECNDHFCETSAKFHLRQKATQNHTVISLQDVEQARFRGRHLGFLQFKSCPKHGRPFEFLNMNCDTHNHLLCARCLPDVSSAHLVCLDSSFASVFSKKLEHIRELGSQGSRHLSELREEEAVLSSRLGELEQSKEQTLGEIRRVFGSLREALDVRERELEAEVEELSKGLLFSLSDDRERSRVWQGQLSMLGQCVEEMEAYVQNQTASSSEASLHLEKGLMVDVCLLEDALRNALSSSQVSKEKITESSRIPESSNGQQLMSFAFSFQLPFYSSASPHSSSNPDEQNYRLHQMLLEGISEMCSVPSSIARPIQASVIPVDWSIDHSRHLLSFYSEGQELNQLISPSSIAYSPISKRFFVSNDNENYIQVFRNHPQAEREGRLEIEFLPPFLKQSTDTESSDSSRSPPGLCFHEGLLFVVEPDNHRILVCREEDGAVIDRLGSGKSKANGEFNTPLNCIVYNNNLFVADQGNHRVQKFSLPGFNHVDSFRPNNRGRYNVFNPTALAVFDGNLYVLDVNNHCLSAFDPDTGADFTTITFKKKFNPMNLLVSHDLLFVSSGHAISVFNAEALRQRQCLYSIGFEGDGNGQFQYPDGMLMVNERLFVCDMENHRIQVFVNEKKEETGLNKKNLFL